MCHCHCVHHHSLIFAALFSCCLLGSVLNLTAPRKFLDKYQLVEKFSAGKYGEVWRAVENRIGSDQQFVVKRMFTEKGFHVYLSGLREVHFGKKLRGKPHIGRFVESFEEHGNMWLVFQDEGPSLHSLLYQTEDQRVIPSPLQQYLTSIRGQNLTREIMRQILEGVHETHEAGVIHRDIKPENIAVKGISQDDYEDLNMLEDALNCIEVKLLDFGSALDEESLHRYYSTGSGPSSNEETWEYQPPEAIFDEFYERNTDVQSYDMWSVGVVFLEMLLGTSRVFQADRKSVAIISLLAEHSSDPNIKQKALLFRALSTYCIYTPKNIAPFLWTNPSMKSIKCKDGTIHLPAEVRINKWGKSLLQWLLKWKPEERISASKALAHAFFRNSGGFDCDVCGKSFEFEEFYHYHITTHHDPYPHNPTDAGIVPFGYDHNNNSKTSHILELISYEVFEEDRRQYIAPY